MDPAVNTAPVLEVPKCWERLLPAFSLPTLLSNRGSKWEQPEEKTEFRPAILLLTSHSESHGEKKIRHYSRILIISVILVTNATSNRKLAWIGQGVLKVNVNLLDTKALLPKTQTPSSSISLHLRAVYFEPSRVCPSPGAGAQSRQQRSLLPEAPREQKPSSERRGMGGGICCFIWEGA